MCSQNPCPFDVIMYRGTWDEAPSHLFLSKLISKLNKFTIIKYVIIKIKADGSLLCSENYNPLFKPFKVFNGHVQNIENIQPQVMASPEVNSAKVGDVRSQYKFLEDEDKDWIESFHKSF